MIKSGNSSTRHVLVACHAWYGDTIGGSFRLASEFAMWLADQGCVVSYVCCGPNASATSQETIEGVNLYRYPPPLGVRTAFGRMRYHIRQSAVLAKRIHDSNPVNAVSGHSPLQGLGAAGGLSAQKVFINYTVHSPFDDEILSNLNGKRPSLTSRLAAHTASRIDRRNVVLADRVQTDSSYTLAEMTRKHSRAMGKKGIVAPGWVETDGFAPAADRFEVRSRLAGPWETSDPLFFTLRRLEQRMGLDTLIDACRQLRDKGVRFRTLIGGGGTLLQVLQQQIDEAGLADCVFLLGRLPEEQLSMAYAAADCFVLPTRALECFGLIVLEALACNTPVIASRAAAIPELAGQQGESWLFQPGDADQLADRMMRFLSKDLRVTADLRAIAMQYTKSAVLQRWRSLLLDDAHSRTE